jgi:6-phosphogluconolactonase
VPTEFVYAGTYTSRGRSKGIYVYRFDRATGGLTPVHEVGGVEDPAFLAFDRARRHLLAIEEIDEGGVASFAVDPAAGGLTFLNRQPTRGVHPCHLCVDPTDRYVLTANYSSGSLTVLPLGADGRLGPATQVRQHVGSGPNRQRQEAPHAHGVGFDPAGRFALAADLGIDRVLVHRLDTGAGKLIANDRPPGELPPGAGPRHLAFHPSGRYLYVNGELDSTLSVFAYNAVDGGLDRRQTRSTLPPGFDGENTTAEIAVHPSGRFVYVSNRGHDSIASFAIDAASGRVTPLAHEPTGGRTPRNFALDPRGQFLLAANQDSDTIVTFRIDPEAGRLAPTGQVAEAPAPVCVLFG